ncbi:MAG TPA: hypothetical protein VMU43_00865 [Candidatus Acidoferrum sp.]|nr:hypothetical protein [Candidatus Acidoferrum sp.]
MPIPPEYYLGAGVAVILLVLLVSLARGKGAKRQAPEKNIGTDRVAEQLSRIADALEKLAGRSEAPAQHVEPAAPLRAEQAPPAKAEQLAPARVEQAPPSHAEPAPPPEAEKAAPPLQKSPEPGPAVETKSSEPEKRHVSLSMFGR